MPLAARCEALIEGTCTVRAAHRHHRLMRSQGGSDDATNTLDVCSPCHRVIHDRPAWAARHGLLTLKGVERPVVAGCPLECGAPHDRTDWDAYESAAQLADSTDDDEMGDPF